MLKQSFSSAKKRLWEIDTLRGVAILMMVTYHLLWDLSNYAGYAIAVTSGFWLLFARMSATTFLLLVGTSLAISRQNSSLVGGNFFLKLLKQGGMVFFWGMVITAVTWIFVPGGVVWFGILHLIGLSVTFAFPFLSLGYWNALIGIFLLFGGFQLQDVRLNFAWLVWLGLKPDNFGSVDYFPILPWFGVVLIGIAFGYWLNASYDNRLILRDFSSLRLIKCLSFLGRHSLPIYLLHQPLLITLLILGGIINSKRFI